MHASSLENMYLCFERFIVGSAFEQQERVSVLDVGGSDYNGSYREVFADPRYAYTAADITDGPGVHLVIQDPYRLPLDDRSVDIVISGQMLEHCEFFWLAFGEMVRVLRPGGFIFLIAPSSGPEHRYPVDCYRFYPDAYRALARYANCAVLDIWLDERGPWRDLVGVFARHDQPSFAAPSHSRARITLADSPLGSLEEEAVRGTVSHIDVLAQLHTALRPSQYFEIGLRNSASLALALGPAICMEPPAHITASLGAETAVVVQTSDAYSTAPAIDSLLSPDLVFINGLRHCEAVLRDFMHAEQYASSTALVVIGDVLPNHPTQAARERRTRVWTGDVWKLVPLLKRLRPDLTLVALDTAPSGLLLIGGLDPANRVLWDQYNPLVRELVQALDPPSDVIERLGAVSPHVGGWKSFCDEISAVPNSKDTLVSALMKLAAHSSLGAPA